MSTNTIGVRHLMRCKTENEWTQNDEVLLNKELGFVTDKNGIYKIGDGIKPFSELEYCAAYTAFKLHNSANISLSGAVTGSVNFDGSGNVTIETSVNHNHDDSYLKLTGGEVSGEVTATKFIGNLEGDASTVCGFKIVLCESYNIYNAINPKDPNTIYFVKGVSIPSVGEPDYVTTTVGYVQEVDDSAIRNLFDNTEVQ